MEDSNIYICIYICMYIYLLLANEGVVAPVFFIIIFFFLLSGGGRQQNWCNSQPRSSYIRVHLQW